VNDINILLKAGLTYSFKLNGNSIKLQLGGTIVFDLILSVFKTNKLINDAVSIPPKYTNPFISELNIEIITKKNVNNIGDIAAKNCNILLKFNCIAMIYIIIV
jgi:hypothetical protein